MAENVLTAHSPLGYTVTCSAEYWAAILSPNGHGHGDMTGREMRVIDALERPHYIFFSIQPIGRHIYFSTPHKANNGKTAYIKVIVNPPSDASQYASIVTAYRTQRIDANKGGTIYDADKSPLL